MIPGLPFWGRLFYWLSSQTLCYEQEQQKIIAQKKARRSEPFLCIHLFPIISLQHSIYQSFFLVL